MRREIKDLGNGLEEVIFFFDNGKVCNKHQLLNGEYHGEEVYFYENGQIRQKCNWVDDKKHGKEVEFYDNGQIAREINWVDNCVVAEFWFNEDGSLAI